VTTALVSSGLPAGRFCFEGFLPPKATQRRARLQELADEPRTLVLFEAPHRLLQLLEDLLAELGDRPIAVTRELTKRHEQQVGPCVSAALEHFRQTPPQGEFTIVLGGADAQDNQPLSEADLQEALNRLLASGLSRSDAARQLAQETGMARRELYALLHRAEEPS
jgi:16S rRNA (cytidine1402-2'-O)-methyltransferase